MEDNYSKREIDNYIKAVENSFIEVKQKLDDVHNENLSAHSRLDENQKITNGKIADIQKWRERANGAAWALGIVTTVIIVPLLTWAFVTIQKIPEKINEGIMSALSNYEITQE